MRSQEIDPVHFLRYLDGLADCEPDVDRLRDVLLKTTVRLSGADGAALFEVEGADVVCRLAIGSCQPLEQQRLSRGGTQVGLAASARDPLLIDVSEAGDSPDAARCRELGLTRVMLLPLRRGRSNGGVVLAASQDPARLSPVSEIVLQPLMRIGAARLEHLALASERAADDQLLAEVAKAGRGVLTADDPAQALCDWARRLTGAAYASFVEPNASGELVLTAQSGAALAPVALSLDEPSLAGTAFVTSRAQIVHDYQRHPEVLARVVAAISAAGLSEPRSAAYLPVRAGETTLGVICLLLDEPFVTQTTTVLGLVSMLAAEAALAIDRDRLRRELELQARTDALTGVANRRVWVARLSLEIARASRTSAPLSAVLLDLDHFKSYNDQHGHQAGDTLLRTVAVHWMGRLREADLLARLGGDEFALLLPDTDAAAAAALCDRLLAGMPDGASASAGIAEWDGVEDQSAFYRRCDAALYGAKQSGRGHARTAS